MTASGSILVLGSTGRRVTARLRAHGAATRAASRHGEVPFDWAAPQTWAPALSGASAMYLMAPHELRSPGEPGTTEPRRGGRG